MEISLLTDISPELKKLQEKLVSLRASDQLCIRNGDTGYADAPANIALLKYWGKIPERTQIPANSSLSLTTGGFRSFTKVTATTSFLPSEIKDQISSSSHTLCLHNPSPNSQAPLTTLLPPKMDKWIRSMLFPFAPEISLDIESRNNFPTACGLASSASGYAALSGAIADLFQLSRHFTAEELQKWLTGWAALGSGSAARSAIIHPQNPFVIWSAPECPEEGFPQTLICPHHHEWNQLEHCVFIMNDKEKSTSSSAGHTAADSSPLHSIRRAGIPRRIQSMKHALHEFDFETVKNLSEEDAFNMHAVMLTGQPSACYLNQETASLISLFIKRRDAEKARAFWTLDAGPNVHFLYMPDAQPLMARLHQEAQRQYGRTIPFLKGEGQGGLFLGYSDSYKEKGSLTKECKETSL